MIALINSVESSMGEKIGVDTTLILDPEGHF